jgi:hypothetical protein
MSDPVLAQWITDAHSVVNWLAVIGGGALGALIVPWLVGLFLRVYTRRQAPPIADRILRILSGLACAALVYVFVFGSGTGGLGGSGGLGVNDGKDGTPSKGSGSATTSPTKQPPKPEQRDSTLTVEVLGDAPLHKIRNSESIDRDHRYRILGKPELLTLPEVQRVFEERQKENQPITRLEIVVYGDSPAKDKPQVKDLEEWARERRVNGVRTAVDFREPERAAPVE